MILIARTRGNGVQLAKYLMNSPANDNAEVFDIRGSLHKEDIHLALREMSLTSELTRSKKGLFHLVINPPQDAKMTATDWIKCTDIIEKYLPFAGQKRVMVLHQKNHIHMHVAYERYDHSKGIMMPDKFFKLALSKARREIEETLEQKRTPFKNREKDEIKTILTRLWKETNSAGEFLKAAQRIGYIICRSESRRPFMVVNESGRSFDLVRQLKAIRTKEVRERLNSCRLENDKTVIRKIRTSLDAEYFDRLQENSVAAILEQKQKYDERQEELKLFRQKLNAMKDSGKQITEDNPLSNAQTRALKMLLKYRDKISQQQQLEIPLKTYTNRKLEKALRELKEVIDQKEKQQNLIHQKNHFKG